MNWLLFLRTMLTNIGDTDNTTTKSDVITGLYSSLLAGIFRMNIHVGSPDEENLRLLMSEMGLNHEQAQKLVDKLVVPLIFGRLVLG
jgi:hypothetical protein